MFEKRFITEKEDRTVKMENQKDLIEKRDWDVLIILDACRYDYFEEIYKDYLEGELKKARSPASATIAWLKEIFSEESYNDTIYISANPLTSTPHQTGFYAKDIFYKVVDVWSHEWGKKDTVNPQKVGKRTRLYKGKYPGKILGDYMIRKPNMKK